MSMNKKTKNVLIIGFLISILIRTYLILRSLDVADVSVMHKIANMVSEGKNPYINADFYIYPPLGVILQYVSLKIADISKIGFHQILRIWPSLADLFIGGLIYKFLIKKKVKPIKASLWAVFFVLNPISIMISTLHGQLDSIPTLLILLSIYFIQFGIKKQKLYLSSLLIGIAFVIKPNPILLLPFLVFYHKSNRDRLKYLAISFIPLVLSLVPFLTNSLLTIIGRLISYLGVYDFGYAAILRSLWYQHNASYWLPSDIQFAEISKITYLLGYLFVVLVLIKTKNLIKTSLTIFILFYAFYFGVSAQYFIWALPFAIIERDKLTLPFTLFCSIALIGFYLFFSPSIILGSLASFKAFQSEMISIYFFGNLFLWLLVIYWFIAIIINYIKKDYSKYSPIRKYSLTLVALLFMISIFPTIRLWLKIQGMS